MSHNIRSKTYMQVAARERSHKAQILQVALGLLLLLSILLWNQMASTEANSSAHIEARSNNALVSIFSADDAQN